MLRKKCHEHQYMTQSKFFVTFQFTCWLTSYKNTSAELVVVTKILAWWLQSIHSYEHKENKKNLTAIRLWLHCSRSKNSHQPSKARHTMGVTEWDRILKFIQTQTHSEQEALQMQRDHAMCNKYEISHLTRFAIGELPSRTLKVITIYYIGHIWVSC